MITLVPCVYIALRCSHCGDLRQALAELPTVAPWSVPNVREIAVSFCSAPDSRKRQLPFHEVHSAEQTRWDRPKMEEKNDSS